MIEDNVRLKCNQCGHPWVRRDLDRLPAICPNNACKSVLWNSDKKARKLGPRKVKAEAEPATPPENPYAKRQKQPQDSSLVYDYSA